MPQTAAGILLYRHSPTLEVLILHHGGPYWAKKDAGAWTFPKGLVEAGEDAETAARREFAEETGGTLSGALVDLGTARMKSGKVNHLFAGAGDFDVDQLASNTFRLQWPPRSGQYRDFPEVDRATWASIPVARTKLNAALLPFLDRLTDHLTS